MLKYFKIIKYSKIAYLYDIKDTNEVKIASFIK